MRTRLSIAAALALAAGCTDNRASIEVAAICAPPDTADKCAFKSTCDAQFIGQSSLDIGQTNHLWMFLQVNNQVPNNENVGEGRVNTMDAWVREYDIEYDGLPVARQRAPIPGASSLVPAGGSAVISVLTVDDVVGAVLQADPSFIPVVPGWVGANAHVRLRGVYGNGSAFETAPFDIAFRVENAGPFVVPGCPTAGDVRFFCPGNFGQSPISTTCAAP